MITPRGVSRWRQHPHPSDADPAVEDLIWGCADCVKLPVLSCGINGPRDSKGSPRIRRRGLLNRSDLISV
jgi:hypothetical protein